MARMETHSFNLMPYRAAEGDYWPFHHDTFDPEKGARYYEDYFRQFELADELGFDGVGFNEHHFSAYGLQPSPVVTAAHVAARTDDVTLAFMGNVVPTRGNPIRVAEEIAMLDNISEGRVLSGFPRGIPTEYAATGTPLEESYGRHREAIELILEAWTAEEPFDWNGEYWQYENVYIWPRPYQDPHPPLWMPAESDESQRFAAEHRIPIGLVFQPPEKMREYFEKFRGFAEEAGWTVTDEDLTVSRAVYVAETDERAREEAEEHLRFFYENLLAGLHRGVTAFMMDGGLFEEERREVVEDNLQPHGELAADFDFEAFREMGEIVVGSPETVAAEIEHQYDAVGGFGRLSGLFQFGSLPPELAERNLELFADEVMPEIRRL